MTDQEYDDQLARLVAEGDEWKRMHDTAVASAIELREKNERLVQLRAEEATVAADRLKTANTEIERLSRMVSQQTNEIESHVRAVHTIQGRKLTVIRIGRLLKSRERAHKRVRMLLESQKAAHSRIGGILEGRDQDCADLRQEIERLTEQLHQTTMKARAQAEEIESLEETLRETHARMLASEASTILPHRRLVITMDWEQVGDGRIKPFIDAALRDMLESGFDGVDFQAGNGVSIMFNSWPSLTQEEAERAGKVGTTVPVEKHEGVTLPNYYPAANSVEADILLMSIGKDDPEIPELTQPMVMMDPSVIEGILGRLERLETHANGLADRLDWHSQIAVATGNAVKAVSDKVAKR